MFYPIIHVVILHYANSDDTIACVKSLQNCTYKNIRIILVDNKSPNNSFQILKNEFPDLPLIQTGENKGYAGGLNVGIEFALKDNAHFILLSNNDIIFSEDFLEPLVETALNNPAAGIISPKVLYASDPEKIYCGGGKLSYALCGGVSEYQGQDAVHYGNNNREISVAEGCCMLVKRDVFEQIGMMNDKFFMYFEEVDFSIRVRRKFSILYESRSVIYHKAGAGLNWADYSPLYYYYYTRNRMMLFSSSNIFYRIYVILFSSLNTLAKSFTLILSYYRIKAVRVKTKKSLHSLWRGYFEGLKLIFRISKPHLTV